MLREVPYMPNNSVLKYPHVPRKNDQNVKNRCILDLCMDSKNQLKMTFFGTFVLLLKFDYLKLTIFKGIYHFMHFF